MHAIGRNLCAFIASAALLALHPGAASASEFVGKWAISGSIVLPTSNITYGPVCTVAQTGHTIAGSCRGPAASGPMSGTISGSRVTWSWRHLPTNAMGINSTATFSGILGPDGVIRGHCTDSAAPGAIGNFTAIRA